MKTEEKIPKVVLILLMAVKIVPVAILAKVILVKAHQAAVVKVAKVGKVGKAMAEAKVTKVISLTPAMKTNVVVEAIPTAMKMTTRKSSEAEVLVATEIDVYNSYLSSVSFLG